jgi:UTP--glucose-1-phosphate uridylyltransferase
MQTSSIDTSLSDNFKYFEEKMKSAKLPPLLIEKFKKYYFQLIQGASGFITCDQIDPVLDAPDADQLKSFERSGKEALSHTVVIKLNGGLGTSMGMDRAKAILPIKCGLTFLDVIARQMLEFRKKSGESVPIIFMNSRNTHEDTRKILAAYPELQTELPMDFIQLRAPKVRQDNLMPVVYPDDPEQEWYPPGHGDIFSSLLTTGLLDRLLDRGIHYAFVSNSDNVGAVLDEQILGFMAESLTPFLMEVADRTPADRKGGHLARLKDGRLTLREVAQCPQSEMAFFQDIALFRYFNTNTIWFDLRILKEKLNQTQGILDLPLIRNAKTVDPKKPASTPVYQLETAMGAALPLFQGAKAIRVSRKRFMPVKTCLDLIMIWSDAYELTPDFNLIENPLKKMPVEIRLDPAFYAMINQLEERFPCGAPSLIDCREWIVEGDVEFGRNITLRGSVRIVNHSSKRLFIPNGSVLDNEILEVD